MSAEFIDLHADNSNDDNITDLNTMNEIEKLLQDYKAFLKKDNNENDNNTKTVEGKHKKAENTPNVEKLLEKSVITPDFEELQQLPSYEISKRQKKKLRMLEKEKSKGHKWYGLPATEMTEEVKNDLEILQMRSVLDPKQFYKKNDLKVLPKYFQIGKVLDSPLDHYSNRLTKKERKRTLVDELMADVEFNKYNKRKYKEIITEKEKTQYKAYMKAKKLKKKTK